MPSDKVGNRLSESHSSWPHEECVILRYQPLRYVSLPSKEKVQQMVTSTFNQSTCKIRNHKRSSVLMNPSSHALERYGGTPHRLEWKASILKSSVITENTQTLDVKTEHPQTTSFRNIMCAKSLLHQKLDCLTIPKSSTTHNSESLESKDGCCITNCNSYNMKYYTTGTYP